MLKLTFSATLLLGICICFSNVVYCTGIHENNAEALICGILLQITSTLTFSAACASAGITVLIGNDLNDCAQNHCSRFETATAMAFMSWFAASPSFILNFWSLASK